MYQLVVFLTCLIYCLSAPVADSTLKKSVTKGDHDEGDVIEFSGGGYSYFKDQQIESRPGGSSAIDMPMEDLAAYVHTSALKGKSNGKEKISSPPLNPTFDATSRQSQSSIFRTKTPIDNLLPQTVQHKRPMLEQNDLTKLPSTSRNKLISQQGNFPSRSSMNTFANQRQSQDDFRGLGSSQFSLPQRNFNLQQTEQSWGKPPKPFGFGLQGQQSLPQNLILNSNQQQRDQSSLFQNSQRFIPSRQVISNNVW